MAILFQQIPCKSCGGTHTFFIAEGGLEPGHQYEYTCPVSRQQAAVVPWVTAQLKRNVPREAVELTLRGTAS